MQKNEIPEYDHRQAPWFTMNNVLSFLFLFLIVFLIIFLPFYSKIAVPASAQGDNVQSGSVLERLLTLERREAQIKELQDKLAAQESLMKEQEETLVNLLEVRTNIIRELMEIFSESNLILDIDSQTGAIRLSEGIFFASNRDVIRANGIDYLNEFVPLYMSILLSETNRDYLAEIIIEGHTDDVGSYIYNLDLSQRRAFAVARYIIEQNIPEFPNKDIIHQYLTANGRSFSQPIMINDSIDQERSRRVEFKFRLKDEELIKEMQQMFEGIE